MSTTAPSRPAPPRPTSSRTRGALPISRAASIDPFRVLRRHMVGIIASILLGGILGVAAHFLFLRFYPLYTGYVHFEVQPGVSEASDVGTQENLKDEDVIRIAKTQLVLLTSRDVLSKAVMDPDVRKTTWFKTWFMEDGTPHPEDAVDELEEDLRTSVVRGTELFEVNWSTHEPRDVPVVLNAIARAYMEMRKDLDNAVFNTNREVFESQLVDTNRKIDDLDREIADFIREKGIQSLDDARYSQTMLAIEELVKQIAVAKSSLNLVYTDYLQTAAKLEGELEYSPEDILEAEQDPSVREHIRMVDVFRIELRVLNEKFPASRQEVRDMETRFRAADAERRAKLDEVIRRNLNARLKSHAHNIERYQRVLEELEDESEAKDAVLRDLAAEQSRYEAKRTQRDHLEASRDSDIQLIKEIKMMRVRRDAARVRIAELAKKPRELSFPQPEIVIPLSVLIVLGLTVGIIFLREITDQRVKSASDLAVLPGARILGVIPDLDDDPTRCKSAELVIRAFPNSVLAESYRQACTPLAKAIDRAGHQTLVFTGGLPGAGTTTAVGNIAAGLAATGRNVLLVDANFRRPRLSEIFGLDGDAAGLGDVLGEAITAGEAVVETESGVSVMAAGTPGSRVIERLNTERFNSIVAELRSRYDVIIFDTPPAVVAGDAMVLANKLDAAVLVVRANQEHRGLVSRLINQIAETHCDLLGILLNRPRGTAGGYFKKNFAAMAAYAKGSS